MGTHPIFESDFDCLTENVSNKNRKLSQMNEAFEIIERLAENELNKSVQFDLLDELDRIWSVMSFANRTEIARKIIISPNKRIIDICVSTGITDLANDILR